MKKECCREQDWEILGIDHVAIAVRNIDVWEAFYVQGCGGKRFYKIEDANPDGPSSMRLCGIKVGGLSLALIQGIDREEVSQVTKYVAQHGDHSYQHIAVAVRNIEAYMRDLCGKGVSLLGELKQREDPTWGGEVKQIFALPFDPELDPDEAPFFEFVERPQKGASFTSGDSFSDDFAKALFQDVEAAAKSGKRKSFISAEALSKIFLAYRK